MTDSAITVVLDREEDVTVLLISPAKVTDSGLYCCMLMSEGGRGFGKGTLVTVRQAAKKTMTKDRRKRSVENEVLSQLETNAWVQCAGPLQGTTP